MELERLEKVKFNYRTIPNLEDYHASFVNEIGLNQTKNYQLLVDSILVKTRNFVLINSRNQNSITRKVVKFVKTFENELDVKEIDDFLLNHMKINKRLILKANK